MNQITTGPQGGMPSIIERAAKDPTIDIDKLQRLIDMQEVQDQRAADRIFNTALVDAEAEMQTIFADSNNPQTRSKYASYGRLDSTIRPIYTGHGLGISFNTEQVTPDVLRVVGTLSHREGGSRRFQIDMPIDTKGARGNDVMTKTHATGSAYTYGKRYLLLGMFNLSVGEEDLDGNAPRRPPSTGSSTGAPRLESNQYMDPETGEIITVTQHQTPGMIEWFEKDTWQTWARRLAVHLRTSANLDEVQQWQDLNKSLLDKLAEEKPAMRTNLASSIDNHKQSFT
jgi:hypothetical protein